MKNRLNLIRLHKRKLLWKQYKQGEHIHQPRHVHSHNNQAVATMESCLALIAVDDDDDDTFIKVSKL